MIFKTHNYIIISFIINIIFYSVGLTQTAGNIATERLDSLVTDANSKDVFSGNVLILKNGNVIFQKSIGYADEVKKIANTSETKFQIGSITKLFTKAIILQMIEENKINGSDNLGKYLTGFPKDIADNVTIQELIDHTSGLGDYFGKFSPETGMSIKTVGDVLPFIQKEKLQFAPGSDKQYSNSGYAVLANIIEKIENKNYGDVLKERILDKIGMDNTGFSVVENSKIPGKAKGYLSNELGPKRDNSELFITGAGDGGMYSTTGDLVKFAQSLTSDNRLLTNDSKLQLFNTPLFPVHYSSWEEFQTMGKMAVAGGAAGISAVLGINMDKNYIMVVLSNYDEHTAEGVAKRISDIMNGRQPKPVSPPPARAIYNLIKENGALKFVTDYKSELDSAGIKLDDDMTLLSVGTQFLREKDADNAIGLYTVYTREYPNIIIAWNDLGDAYLLNKDYDNAKKSYEQALKVNPGNERAKKSLQKLNK